MTSNRLALLTLVVGLALGFVVGAMLGSDTGRPARAAEGPRGITRDTAPRAASPREEATLAPVGDGTLAASRTSPQPSGLAAATARATGERVVAQLADDDDEDRAAWTGRITGVVVDEDGRPVVGATVVSNYNSTSAGVRGRGMSTANEGRPWTGFTDIEDAAAATARRELRQRRNARSSVTDERGRFELSELRAGVHSLQAYAEDLVFSSQAVQVGDSARLDGQRVGVFTLDVRLPDGAAPAEATVLICNERHAPAYRWTPDEPTLRLRVRVVQFEVLAGDVRSFDWRNYVSEFSSPSRTIDLARDGEGPHPFQLEPRVTLRVTVHDASSLAPRIAVWVRAIDAKQVKGSAAAVLLAEGKALMHEGESRYVVGDLAPGRYVIGAGRGNGEAEVTATVDIVRGTTAAELQLGEIDRSRFLIVRCTGPTGAPLSRVSFSSVVSRQGGTGSGNLESTERPGGEYWLHVKELLRGNTWDHETQVRVVATAPNLGRLETKLAERQRELNITFRAVCDLVVFVTGDLSPGYSVSVTPRNDSPAEGARDDWPGSLRGTTTLRVDGEGRAMFAGLQPGPIDVTLSSSSSRTFESGRPCVSQVADLRPGRQTIQLMAPTLHGLVVHAPELAPGTSLILQRSVDGSSARESKLSKLGADRRARFSAVVAGEYTLQCWGEVSGQMSIVVPSGEVLFAP